MNMLLPLYLDNVQHTMVIVDVQMRMKLKLYKLNQYNHHNYGISNVVIINAKNSGTYLQLSCRRPPLPDAQT
jgi:hypothetical protein